MNRITDKKKNNKAIKVVGKGIEAVLRSNANSTGCYMINQPKAPKSLDKFKKFEEKRYLILVLYTQKVTIMRDAATVH